ncbi:MAG: class I SAM-dependent methyltransferase [Fimbriimonas sp.]|nr:class I SAM-dependent methyltransferase [Fimbriimonas sp.]
MSSASSSPESIDAALEEQKAYYRARAAEYDEWFLRRGRYARGSEHSERWFREVERVVADLEQFAPYGQALELAGGTGLWTLRLAPHAEQVTVVDASREMIEINKERLEGHAVRYLEQDIFSFEPDRRYDFMFFSFWISHVPSDLFDEFWAMVKRCLKPDGKVFFLDSLKEPQSTAVDHVLPGEDHSETLVRRLNDGREFRIFKLFYKPDELRERLDGLGLDTTVLATENFFLYGYGGLKQG